MQNDNWKASLDNYLTRAPEDEPGYWDDKPEPDDDHCPTCGCSGDCIPAMSTADRKLLNAIFEYFDDTGDGAPDSSSLARQNLNFSEPLHQLIRRLR